MKTIVITGAGSGIGAEVARQLSRKGCALVLHTRANADGLRAVADQCRAEGVPVAEVMGDLREPSVSLTLAQAARQEFGRIDGLVSNAGHAIQGSFASGVSDALPDAFATMPIAFARLVEAMLPDLVASGAGRVVAVSSFVAHLFGTNGLHFPASSAAKAALEALTKSLFTRKERKASQAIASAQFSAAAQLAPTGRLCEPSDVASLILYLLSDEARQINGQVFHVDGGLGLA
ncbi:MAG: SDR family oxidoreductase [Cypionkella sp.]|nr:SDR family oxidoreductase [Cypionkella sp.]